MEEMSKLQNTMAELPEIDKKFVVIAIKRLQEKEEMLKKDLNELQSRLEPILKPQQPMAKIRDEESVPEMSIYGNELYQIGDGLYGSHLWINELLERLDL